MNPAIRDAVATDAAAIALLMVELGYEISIAQALAGVRRFKHDSASRLLVAELSGDVIGLIGTHVVPRLDGDGFSCRITDLVVSARVRRRGVDTALVTAADAEARRHAAPRLDLSSRDSRSDAHDFYTSLGFQSRSRTLTRRLR